jgi:hypothetical protein
MLLAKRFDTLHRQTIAKDPASLVYRRTDPRKRRAETISEVRWRRNRAELVRGKSLSASDRQAIQKDRARLIRSQARPQGHVRKTIAQTLERCASELENGSEDWQRNGRRITQRRRHDN